MNRLGMLLFDMTSLALVLLAVCFTYLSQYLWLFLLIFLILLIIFNFLLKYAINTLEGLPKNIPKDIVKKDIKAFWSMPLLVLPILKKEFDIYISIDILNPIIILLGICLFVAYCFSNITTYNLFFLLFRYHYYEIKIGNDTYTLISKNKNLKSSKVIKVIDVANSIIIEKD